MENGENGQQQQPQEEPSPDSSQPSETERLQKKLNETEEKLVKFKEFVVKLRNERTGLQKELSDEKSKAAKLQTEVDRFNSKSYQQLFQNFQNLQTEYDRCQDDNEKLKKNGKKLESDLLKCCEELTHHKELCLTQKDDIQSGHNQLKAKQAQIEELVNANKELESRIIILETDLKSEKKKASTLPAFEVQISSLKEEVNQKDGQIETLLGKVNELETKSNKLDNFSADNQQLTKQLETLKKEHEDIVEQNVNNLKIIDDQTSLIATYKKNAEDLEAKLSSTQKLNEEIKLTSSKTKSSLDIIIEQLETKLKLTQEDLSLNQAKFEEYQLKVSNVLKGSKTSNLDYEKVIENLNFKISSLEEESNSLRLKLKSTEAECQAAIGERDIYKTRLDHIESKLVEFDHMKQRTKQLESESNKLQSQLHQLTSSFTAEKTKIVSDNMTHVASVKDLYETQIKKLQEDLANSRLHSEDSTSLVNSNISSDEIKDDHSFVCTEPKVEKNFLEEILNGDTTPSYVSNEIQNPEIDNLTQLLKESENSINLLTEQNRVLKDEIRRLHRSMEKIDTTNNLEYLRNVLFKGVSERERLVTVLATMLKFNEEEIKLVHELVAEDGRANGNTSKWSLW